MDPSAFRPQHAPVLQVLDVVFVDVEGGETAVLRAWPFDAQWCVSAFTVENNNWCNASQGVMQELSGILVPRGYKHVRSLNMDEVFLRQPPCRKLKPPTSKVSPIRH